MVLLDFDGIIWTKLFTDTAFDADVGVNHMCFSAFTRDRLNGAVPGTKCTTGAFPINDLKANQRFTNLRWATFFVDVGFVFVQEVFQSTLNGVGGSFSQTAETVFVNFFA
jgi:hypothetical protein